MIDRIDFHMDKNCANCKELIAEEIKVEVSKAIDKLVEKATKNSKNNPSDGIYIRIQVLEEIAKDIKERY